MHDCNRHRDNGYRDVTWKHKIEDDHMLLFKKKRDEDLDRQQHLLNMRFPTMADARDQYIEKEKEALL